MARQALSLRRQLAADQPERFERELAGSLINLADFLATSGLLDEAREICEEGKSLSAKIALRSPIPANETLHWLADWTLRWLNTLSAGPLYKSEARECPDLGRDGHEQRFAESCLSLFSDPSRSIDQRDADRIARLWDAMDTARHIAWEELLLVCCALFEAEEKRPPVSDWPARWRSFFTQRQGQVPKWMDLANQRFGAEWPS